MDPAKVSRALRGARAIKFIGSPMTRLAGTPITTWSWSVKVGDLVKYRASTHHTHHNDWLGIIVREIPGNHEIKVIEWTHREGGTDRGSYRARDLEVVSESR
jgi:hypothetical protein